MAKAARKAAAKPKRNRAAAPAQPPAADPAAAENQPAAAAAQPATEPAPKRGPGRPRKERPTGGNGPSPEQEAETLSALIRLDTEAARISQEKGTILNRFEKMGGDKKAIKAVKTLLMLDEREAQAYLERLTRYSANAGIAVGWRADGQAELTDVLTEGTTYYAGKEVVPPKNTEGTRDLAAARAHSDGFNSGVKGAQPKDNPFSHKPGSEEYVSWLDGRDEGQRATEIKATPGVGGTASPTVPF